MDLSPDFKLARKRAIVEASSAYFSDARFAELLGDRKFVLIDGGAKGGVQKEWVPLLPILKVVAFDPYWSEEVNASAKPGASSANGSAGEKSKPYPAETIFVPKGLGPSEEAQPFYVTTGPSMRSVIPPDTERARLYGLGDYAVVQSVVDIPMTTIDAAVAQYELPFVDFIKLDTQGSELDVLKGAPKTVGRMAFGLRVETCLNPLYERQPLFTDVDTYVRAQGFEFIDFMHMLRYRRRAATLPGADGAVRQDLGLGQLVVADPLYFRPPAFVVEHLEPMCPADRQRYVIGALIGCFVYGRLDYALELLAHAAPFLAPPATATMRDLIDAFPAQCLIR
ncbi:MAG: FkbM family methyltransferase [Vicinamibacterales bacterium]